ncbi:hypothetical protein HYFRA_00001782 [Hymenoscyphus fraxineus]|uniref:Rhodopsin domain-containing protein n=1 Tax=Hymenoscyphus fraxineus TaxID=746836 RepID=A0A9N9KMG7_9HELO|nr:hypothetical protein HYFRA_00001782 [Hymenoscyphus fraxineus]
MMNPTESALLGVSIAFPLLATISVGLRFKARKIKSSLQADDWVTLVALILCLALAANSITGVAIGVIGKSQQSLSIQEATALLKIIYGDSFIVFATLGVVKIGILIFYKSIFISKRFKTCANIMMLVVFLWWFSTFFALLFSVSPITAQWDVRSKNSEQNINFAAFLMTHASMDLFFDVTILLFPVPAITKLRMKRNRKISVIAILWLGFFCVVASSVRIWYFKEFLFEDFTYHADAFGPVVSNIFIWSRIEPCCSVVAACLPTFGPLFENGRTPESIVASFRSVLSIRSSNNSLSTNRAGKDSSEIAKKTDAENAEARAHWQSVHSSANTTVEHDSSGRLEPRDGEIIMEKTFSSQ